MSNYTRPNDPDHKDDPKDWLNSAMIFARALSLLLNENSGVVVKLKGEMENPAGESKTVIVFSKNGQIMIDDAEDSVKEGTLCQIIDPDENLN